MDEQGEELADGQWQEDTEHLSFLAWKENKAIKSADFTGVMMRDCLTLTMNGKEKLLVNADIFRVNKVGTPITDKNAEGFVGLRPYTNDVGLL